MSDAPPPIHFRKKTVQTALHGGSWKVAYADFTTAMMAFFMILWLTSCPEEIQDQVSHYFRDPIGSTKMRQSSYPYTGESVQFDRSLIDLRDRMQLALKRMPNLDGLKANILMTVTGEGLRIDLFENENSTFFESGRSTPTPPAREFLIELAKQLGQMPNRVVIEGHTDGNAFSKDAPYTNWELSADRANAARKVMQEHGLKHNQVIQISGDADRQLRIADHPASPSNRRISIVVSYAHLLKS